MWSVSELNNISGQYPAWTFVIYCNSGLAEKMRKLHFTLFRIAVQWLFNPPPCASTGKRGGTVSCLTPQSKSVASLISLLTFLFFSAPAAAHTVGLSWDARTFPNVVGYNIYRGPSANGPYTKINSSLDPNTTYSDTTLQAGETYYYVTTAVDNQGVERAYSNQSEATIPGGGSGSERALYSFAGGAKG
jgi:hypothetical protein